MIPPTMKTPRARAIDKPLRALRPLRADETAGACSSQHTRITPDDPCDGILFDEGGGGKPSLREEDCLVI